MAAGGEFVEGWLVAQLLGEGAYGEVRLLVHARSGACVALKVSRGAARMQGAAREAALQRALRHPHVVRCLGARAHRDAHYTFLEYLPGGELFERIRPDAGMPPARARRYLAHALAALRYLHARGVAHRDLKPENMLLDAADNLKLSDFGMATLYRHGARERLMTRVCGTVPYAAPEVLEASARRPYRAPPADVWALAVVLVAMLAGELAWERAQAGDARYAAWSAAAAAPEAALPAPWTKIRGPARALLRRALRPDPQRRATLPQLLQHRWLAGDDADDATRAWRSQPAAPALAPASAPAPAPAPAPAAAELSAADMDALISYSQPTRAADLLVAGTQDATQPGAWSWARLTRVRVRGARDEALRGAARALAAAGWPAAVRADGATLTVECGADVQMRAWAVPGGAAHDTLLEFRRARGCGLAFQRRFRDVRRVLAASACAPAPAPAPASAPAPAEPMDVL